MDATVLKRLRSIAELVSSYVFLASIGLLVRGPDQPYLALSVIALWGILFVCSYLWGCYDFEVGIAYGVSWRTLGVFISTLAVYLLVQRLLLVRLVPFPHWWWPSLLVYLALLSPLVTLPVSKLAGVPALAVYSSLSETEKQVLRRWGYECRGVIPCAELAQWLESNSDERRRPKGYEVILLDLADPMCEATALELSRVYFVDLLGVHSTRLWPYLRGTHCKRISFMPMRGLNRRVKRVVDVLISVLALIALSPLLLLIIIAVKLDSPGPVLYKHRRLGKDMRHFWLLKFRTMFRDADKRLERILAENPELRAEFEAHYKLRNDPRVTRVGKFLRSSSLDELPQLLNVIQDQMSLVGPRPIVDGEIGYYTPCNLLPFRVMPGATGLWQISGRNETSYQRRVELDVQYVKNWSYWGDIKILLGTLPAVLKGRGAY